MSFVGCWLLDVDCCVDVPAVVCSNRWSFVMVLRDSGSGSGSCGGGSSSCCLFGCLATSRRLVWCSVRHRLEGTRREQFVVLFVTSVGKL